MKILLLTVAAANLVYLVYLCRQFNHHYRRALRHARKLQGV